MTLSTPRVSIGLPVYNGAKFIGEALDSLLGQTYTNFELVISDNASTDETERICREFIARDPRITYHRLPENLGAIANFNRLFRLTTGEYFKWASADDVCLPTFLEELVAILDRHPDVVWCHTQTGKIDGHGRILLADDPAAEGLAHTSAAGFPRDGYNSDRAHRRYRGVLLGTTWCADSFGLFRRSALEKTELFPACYGSEKVLLGELAIMGAYHDVSETLFYQRVHEGASGHLNTSRQQNEHVLARRTVPFASSRLALLHAHVRTVSRASIPWHERVLCYGVVANYVLQWRKWWHVLSSEALGKPIKGYYRLPRSGAHKIASPVQHWR